MNWFREHWQGKYSLPVSYWANGFASGLVAFAAAMAVSFGAGHLYANSGTTNDQQQIANFGLTMGVLAYLPFIVWWTVGTWRSATNRGKGNFWGIFTKCVLVFLMILLPLQMFTYYGPIAVLASLVAVAMIFGAISSTPLAELTTSLSVLLLVLAIGSTHAAPVPLFEASRRACDSQMAPPD